MPVTDLATVTQVKAWVPSPPVSPSDDTLLADLITACSLTILNYIQRGTVLSKPYTDVFDGYGEMKKMLRHWPVTSVAAVNLGNTTVQPSGNMQTSGFVLEAWDGQLPGGPQLLALRGFCYDRGIQNVAVTYQAGYLTAAEPQTIPATPFQVTPDQLNGPWAQDAGVVNGTTGVAMVKVASGTPTAGQYKVAAGIYTFAAADTGVPVLISYSYIPGPLNRATVEQVGEAYTYRQRIGARSQNAPGPLSTTFDLSRLTPAQRVMVDQFKNVVPIP